MGSKTRRVGWMHLVVSELCASVFVWKEIQKDFKEKSSLDEEK